MLLRRLRGVELLLLLLQAVLAAGLRDQGVPAAAPPVDGEGPRSAQGLPRLSPDVVRHVLELLRFRYVFATFAEAGGGGLWRSDGVRRPLRAEARPRRLPERAEERGVGGGVRFFPAGDRVLVWSARRVVVWDVASGQSLRILRHDGVVRRARVLPKSGHIAVRLVDGRVVIWDAGSGAAVSRFGERWHLSGPTSGFLAAQLEVFPSGERLLTYGRESWATVWEVATGSSLSELRGEHEVAIIHGAVFPDNWRVVTGGFDETVVIWSVSEGRALHRLPHPHLTGLAVVAGGDAVVTTGHDSTAMWCADSGERLREWLGSASSARPFLWDARVALISSVMVRVVDSSSGEKLAELNHWPSPIDVVDVSTGGDLIVSRACGQLRIWDAASGELLRQFEEAMMSDWLSLEDVLDESLDIGLSTALDPLGFGRGLRWSELPGPTPAARP